MSLQGHTERYDAASIVVLRGLRGVRERPTMYVGQTGHGGILHLVHEVVQNAVDEVLAGCCTRIDVVLHPDGSIAVTDDGRGIPVEIHPETGRPACETVMTTLHSGAKFNHAAYSVSGGMHGVGLSCVNALSEWLVLRVKRDGLTHEQRFARGDATSELQIVDRTLTTGTAIHFLPDYALFGVEGPPPVAELRERLLEIAYLHAGLTVTLRDIGGEVDEWRFETGLVGYVAALNRSHRTLHAEPIHVKSKSGDVSVDCALQWTIGRAEEMHSFVNGIATRKGGTHTDGLRSALLHALNRFARGQGLITDADGGDIPGLDLRDGLVAVLSVTMASPEFEGQTKATLTSRGVAEAVERAVTGEIEAMLEADPGLGRRIVARAIEASRARTAARRAGERARYRNHERPISKEVYVAQFGVRSQNWHDSANWITDGGLLEQHAKMCRVESDARVLDVCCGSGVVGASFRGRVGRIVGLDLTPEMVQLARTRLDEVHQGDVYHLPFDDKSFDLVCNREVLHLLPHPGRPLAEVFRVLRPGGQLIVGQWVPFGDGDEAWMYRVVKKKQPLFFNNLTVESTTQLLRGVGFEHIEMTEYLQWEDIDNWINTHETPSLNRYEIRQLYYEAPAEARAVHPFEVSATGKIRDCWRWSIFSAMKPGPRSTKRS